MARNNPYKALLAYHEAMRLRRIAVFSLFLAAVGVVTVLMGIALLAEGLALPARPCIDVSGVDPMVSPGFLLATVMESFIAGGLFTMLAGIGLIITGVFFSVRTGREMEEKRGENYFLRKEIG